MESTYRIKMRNLIILFICCFGYHSQAQNFDEFFNQKKTQKEYLIKQIALLKFYGNFLKEGYGIVDSGLNTIKNFNKTEYNLHSSYFTSLESINPTIAKSPIVDEIIRYKTGTISLLTNLKTPFQMGSYQAKFIEEVKSKVISETQKEFNFFKLVLTPGKLILTDEERLIQIQKIHNSIKEKYEFAQSFVDNVRLVINQKQQEQLQFQASKKIFNLK